MAHRRSNSRFEKVIDDVRWSGANHSFLAATAGSSAQLMVSDGDRETILRIRGEIISYGDGVQDPDGALIDCALGAMVVQAGSGTTVIQAPLTDEDAPWFFYERWQLGYEEMVVDVIDVPGITSYRKTIDSKSMRILREGREVQLVFEQITLNNAMTANTSFGFRMLLGTR